MSNPMERFVGLARDFIRIVPDAPKPSPHPDEIEAERFGEWAQDAVTRVHFVEWLDDRIDLLEAESQKSMSDLGALAGCTRARQELTFIRKKIREWARFANQGPSQGEVNG